MKKLGLLSTLLVAGLLLTGCLEKAQDCIGGEAACTREIKVEEPEEQNILVIQDEEMNTDNVINLKIGDKTFDVTLEDNSATKALLEKLKEGYVVVNAHEYGGFEKVGDLGFDLPREDKQITTQLGDIVLYNGNQISLFYDSNSWSYTKLGKVMMVNKESLKEVLGDGDVTLTFSLKK